MDDELLDLNPYVKTSPSSLVRLEVDPDARDGGGSSSYRVTKEGRLLWEGNRQYSLWEAEVLDGGAIAGYAYRGKNRGDEFLVVILAPDGTERLKTAIPRTPSQFHHFPPNPRVVGMWVDPDHDRFVIRIADPDVNRHWETWLVHRLSTGEEISRLQPSASISRVGKVSRSIRTAAPVLGTPLSLIHLWRSEQTSGLPRRGAQFTLIEPDGKHVWSIELPDDYALTGDRDADRELEWNILRNGAILNSDTRGSFCVRFTALSQRVTFAVSSEGSKWSVRETGRTPYEPFDTRPKTSVPELALRLLAKFELDTWNSGPPSASLLLLSKVIDRPLWRNIDAIAVGPGNDLYALMAQQRRIDVYSGKGAVVRRVTVERSDLQQDSHRFTLHVLTDGTVCIGSENFTTARLTRIDPSGQRLPPVIVDNVIGSMWYPMWNGENAWIAGFRCLTWVSLAGLPERTIERRPDRNWIGNINDAGVAPNGDFAILEEKQPFRDGVSGLISLFSAGGEPLTCLRTPPELSGVAALAGDNDRLYVTSDSGLLVYHLAGGYWSRMDLPTRSNPEMTTWRPLISHNGAELFLFDGARLILRYDLTS